ncbi:MAG TPA: hypothetical protein VNW97_12175 [Candidatus Saccharimonadales bacterium]|jgi:hypothetical protein|nr:hypothetical protein [Candidatus Saccharimonadales bacterium]
MGRLFSLLIVLAITGAGAYMFMHQAQTASGSTNPASTIDMVAIKRDLMNIARAERNYQVLHASFASISDLHSSGDLSAGQDSRGPYNYSIDTTASGFHVIATYAGPENTSIPRTISVDETMHFSQE